MSAEHSRSFLKSVKKAAGIGVTALALGVVSTPTAVGTYYLYDFYTHHGNIPAPTEQDYKDAKGRVLQYESGFKDFNPRGYAFGKPVSEPDPSNFNDPKLQRAYQVIDQQNYYQQHHVSGDLLGALGATVILYESVAVGLIMVSKNRRKSSC